MALKWGREGQFSKTYALKDDSSQHVLARMIAPLVGSYQITYGNSKVLLKMNNLGTRIPILDEVLGRELRTISCSFRGFYIVPKMLEWNDGRYLYIPPPSVVQGNDLPEFVYSLALKDEQGRRLMRMEWSLKKPGLVPNVANSKAREQCLVTPEELPSKDPDFPLISGIGWITILQLIWLDQMFV